MRVILATILSCFMSLSFAQELSVGADAVAQAAQKCDQGCLILDQRDIFNLNGAIQEFLGQAYQEGIQAGVEAAKDNPKICPKSV